VEGLKPILTDVMCFYNIANAVKPKVHRIAIKTGIHVEYYAKYVYETFVEAAKILEIVAGDYES
jgi:hypothetical protein